jgi:predicted O-linked N-acetylglucosamine transferase (SPINDLY family)
MGVPVITLVGTAFFERLSYSNLSNAGLGDLAAFSHDDFVKKAVTLAEDTKRRTYLRSALRRQIKDRPLGQPEQFAKDFYDLVAKTVNEAR